LGIRDHAEQGNLYKVEATTIRLQSSPTVELTVLPTRKYFPGFKTTQLQGGSTIA
jgi:hypothetical protein